MIAPIIAGTASEPPTAMDDGNPLLKLFYSIKKSFL